MKMIALKSKKLDKFYLIIVKLPKSVEILVNFRTKFLENIKIGEDIRHFVAWSIKGGIRFYIIYKFLNKTDPCGYDIYDAVTILNHS